MTGINLTFALWVWTVCGVWAALVNHGRGNSAATGFGLGILLGPLGLLITLVTPAKGGAPRSECPHCGLVQDDAHTFCIGCGKALG